MCPNQPGAALGARVTQGQVAKTTKNFFFILTRPIVWSLSDIGDRDEAKEVQPDTRPQARKNRRRIRWNMLRIFSGRARRRWSWMVPQYNGQCRTGS